MTLSNTKKIAKMLLDQKIDARTIRNELSQIRTMRLMAELGDSEELRKLKKKSSIVNEITENT